jgi:pimeloyl-ACP methyl ester carboxylesterase
MLSKSIHALRPLLYQALLFGYIAAFQLPPFMVKYLGIGGNFAFYRGALGAAHRQHREDYHEGESLAATFGPSLLECKTQTTSAKPETYGQTVTARAASPGNVVMSQTSYYRDGLAFDHWSKSLEIITDLHSIELTNRNGSLTRRRSSSTSSTLFIEHYKGSLHAPVTILWGQRDLACSQAICLDGIGDYLARDSEVVLLPRTGHWVPVEREGREVLARVLDYFVVGDRIVGSVGEMVRSSCEGAGVMVRK